MKRDTLTVIAAAALTASILALSYFAFGFWTTVVLMSGFLGGLVLWLIFPAQPEYKKFRSAYFVTFALFALHRVEEKQANFFSALADLTKEPKPEILSWHVILLVFTSVGAWILVPSLTKRKTAFGYYLAWTFFASTGITELAHFVFPLFREESYTYFPGMVSVFALAPTAWLGMYRLARYG